MLPEFLTERVDKFYETRIARHGGNVFNGRVPGSGSILLNSNDYLALSRHPAILVAQSRRLLEEGSGPQMSAVFLNEYDGPYSRLQQSLAEYVQMDAAVLCQSGYAANVGLIQSIADRQAPVYIDRFAHMSLWEGAHSAGATARMFKHNDVNHLESRIRRYGSGTVVVDSVYSALGTRAPLQAICEVCERYDCTLVVDESHSLGLFGPHGAGLVADLGLSDRVNFITASLAKAFASRAGVIFGPQRILSYFPWEARPAIFSTMLEPHDVARIQRTLEIVRDADDRRQRLFEVVQDVRNHMIVEGYTCAALSASPIIPLLAGSEESTTFLRDRLEDFDVFGAVFVKPTTPPDRTLLRLSFHSALSEDDVELIKAVIVGVREQVRPEMWPDPFAGMA